jgi:Xaa-Pro aminopeptidase
MMNHRHRLTSIQRDINKQRLHAFVVTHPANIRYLCGFTGSSGVLVCAREDWVFFTDGRYTQQAKAEVQGAAVRANSSTPLIQATRWIATKLKSLRGRMHIGVEADHLTLSAKARISAELQNELPRSKYRLVETSGMVERLRVIKDQGEIQQIRSAVELASSIFSEAIANIASGTTENVISAHLDFLARKAGAEKMSFETIVASGSRSALPHARPTHEAIVRGFVVLDYGVIVSGYCSDMTRTVHVGRADDASRDLYAAVLEAQLAGIAAVKPGIEAAQVDEAARKVLRKRKLDKFFTHSLGHGLGLEIHEVPRLAKGQTQLLEPGMVITIEPGAYIPGTGGVRIEDTVLVTKTGCEVLTPTSKELVICYE